MAGRNPRQDRTVLTISRLGVQGAITIFGACRLRQTPNRSDRAVSQFQVRSRKIDLRHSSLAFRSQHGVQSANSFTSSLFTVVKPAIADCSS